MRSLLVWLRARLDDRTVVMTEEMKRLLGRSDAHVISHGTALDLLKPGAQTEGGRPSLHLAATGLWKG